MYDVARRRLRNSQDAEDAVQIAAVSLVQQRTDPINEKTICYLLAHRAAMYVLQRERYRRHEPVELDNPMHHRLAPSAEREAMATMELAEAAGRAPACVLARAAGYAVREIAGATGERPNTVTVRIRTWRLNDQRRRILEAL